MKIDNSFTRLVEDYLAREDKEAGDVLQGAQLLVRINPRNTIYRRWMSVALIRPGSIKAKIDYELRKHLRYRLDGLTLEEVNRLDADVTARITALMSGEKQEESDGENDGETPTLGRRADHDSLPEDIRQLWDDNAALWKKMKQWFEELKAMENAMPCDRYDLLQQLKSADEKYHRQMETYDAYVITPQGVASPAETEAAVTDNAKVIVSARAYISKNKKTLAALIAKGDEEKAAARRAEMQKRADTLLMLGAEMTDELRQELAGMGITFSDGQD